MTDENVNPVQMLQDNRPEKGDSEEVKLKKAQNRARAQINMYLARSKDNDKRENLDFCANLSSMATSVDEKGDYGDYVNKVDRFSGNRQGRDD